MFHNQEWSATRFPSVTGILAFSNIGTQSLQELFFCDRSIRRTVYSNDFV